jgi:hypothetical protein
VPLEDVDSLDDLGAMYAEAFTEWASSDEGADWDGVDTAGAVS